MTLVYLTDADFRAAEEDTYRTIEILDFVPHDEIDPIVFQRTYYLGPAEGAEKVYALLVKAMEDSELSAVARYVFRDRQQLGTLRVRDGVITLESMYFADEIRPTEGILPGSAPAWTSASSKWPRLSSSASRPRSTTRSMRTSIRRGCAPIVQRKRKGQEVHAPAEGGARGADRLARGVARERRIGEALEGGRLDGLEERALEGHRASEAKTRENTRKPLRVVTLLGPESRLAGEGVVDRAEILDRLLDVAACRLAELGTLCGIACREVALDRPRVPRLCAQPVANRVPVRFEHALDEVGVLADRRIRVPLGVRFDRRPLTLPQMEVGARLRAVVPVDGAHSFDPVLCSMRPLVPCPDDRKPHVATRISA